ncbi:acyl-CoA dehydrogenase [Ahniella affigens]|uniref:3-methylmercaptopropionyl-CoA dehydrogenase n=1 Tax=Ahniella affigens TaxID=2021234 RepID=A0A2P1PPY4_9GAMM|nr:acyl-CoA dehydrogenase C-terminal domain-containing protein [Ahniella affigens]AVP96888.1 acyl-CoA dehydrogenase [Ahniella affigens]
MSRYTAPLTDMRFALFDVLGAESIFTALNGGDGHTRDLLDAVLDEGARFNEQVLAPLNKTGDQEGCKFEAGKVTTPKGFKEAYQQFVDGGWAGLTAPADMGGQELPEAIGAVIKEMIDSANLSWGTYPLLSHGATESLKAIGTDWQKETFLKPIVEGRWTGTMCLTEPHCGSDLGLLKTKAEPAGDGTYRISGTKIFITAGEHDLTDNIVHLVLARLPDAPAGTRGISLFIVPKFKVNQAGQTGERNAAYCGSIEHKMGIKASATCVMNFDAAEGYLIGEPNKGLAGMFIMMNTARLAVGLQGLGLMERAYQNALAYAKDRLQMRALTGPKRPDKPADPLIVHPDIRRMLLTQKAFIEAGRVLTYRACLQVDIAHRSQNEQERKNADDLLGFLTPIVKAMMTELAVECCYHAQQVFGGHGYIQEWGMEQLARDARITTIYEGTTGIQALDLIGRKIMQLQGAGLRLFAAEIGEFCASATGDAAAFAATLGALTQEWVGLTQSIGAKAAKNPDELGAAATDYLFYSGYISMAYALAQSVAKSQVRGGDFHTSKLATTRFYFDRILPRVAQHKAAVQSGADNLMQLDEALFG